MKKTVFLFMVFLTLFSCEKDEVISSLPQQCNVVKYDQFIEGEFRTYFNTFDSLNRISSKCIAFDQVITDCFDIRYSNNSKTVCYLYTDPTTNKIDTFYKGIYLNNRLIEYYINDGSLSNKIVLSYDSITNKLIKLEEIEGLNKKIYSVLTDKDGDPIFLNLESRNTSSVFDILELEINYDNKINPLKNDLSTQSWIYILANKNFNSIKYTNAENNITRLQQVSQYNSNNYPIQVTLKEFSADTISIRKFDYECN